MGRDQNIAALERLGEAINSGDYAAFDEVVAPDCADHDPAPVQGAGPGGFRDLFTELRSAFPDLRVDVDHLTATENDVVLAYTLTGTHHGLFMGIEATGRPVEVRGVQIGRFRDGQLVERWGTSNKLGILRQLGETGVA